MLKWFVRILIAVGLMGGWAVAARCVHIIHSIDTITGQDRFGILPKARWMFDDTYLDVRGWTAADIGTHRDLVRHIARSGKADLLKHVAAKDFSGDLAAWLTETANSPSATQPGI
ncbi:MAG TPA: hypothetical protein PLD59_14725 [Tepidisphaeraceae bacterium]|nr:hypothetical protein [Tepidisphaeraceae bacterium]